MSAECSECERDLRGGHDPSCSRYVSPPRCVKCGKFVFDDDGLWCCETHGYVRTTADTMEQ